MGLMEPDQNMIRWAMRFFDPSLLKVRRAHGEFYGTSWGLSFTDQAYHLYDYLHKKQSNIP